MTVIWIIGVTVAMLGVLQTVRGIRGHGSTAGAPRCRDCGQRVTALQAAEGPGPDDRCPECGRTLSGSGITRRRVRWRLITVGVLLTVVGLGGPAAWPGFAWRAQHFPTWWLVHVERAVATDATRPRLLEAFADRRADPARGLSDAHLMLLVDEFLADLRGPYAVLLDPPTLEPSRRLFEEALVAGLVRTEDVALVHRRGTLLQFTAEPMPPTQLALSWRIVREPGTVDRRPRATGPAGPTNAAQPVAVEPADVRVGGRSIVDAGWRWNGHTSTGLWRRPGSAGYATSIETGETPLAAGWHAVALDLRHRAGPHEWIETVVARVLVPEWPPAGHPGIGPAMLRGAPPDVRLMTLEQYASTRTEPHAVATARTFVDRFTATTLVLVGVLRLDPQVVAVEGVYDGMAIELVDGRTVPLSFLSAEVGSMGRAARASASATTIRFVHRLPDEAADLMEDLPATIDLLVPFGRARIRVARADLLPPPEPGEPEIIEGWLPAPPDGLLRLDGLVLRGSEPES